MSANLADVHPRQRGRAVIPDERRQPPATGVRVRGQTGFCRADYLWAMGRTSPYAVGIRPATTVWAPGTAPLPPKAWVGRGARTTKLRRESGNEPVSARALAMRLDSQAWRTVTWREGANDTLSGRFAALRVRPAHRDYLQTAMRAEEWLLIEWPEGEKEPVKYFLSTAPEDATLEQMVFACKMRWRIERDYQDLKQDFGLGHYEGRGWRGFHHHATLSIAAYGFLMARRLEMGSSGDGEVKKTSPNARCLPFPTISCLGEANAPSSSACAAYPPEH